MQSPSPADAGDSRDPVGHREALTGWHGLVPPWGAESLPASAVRLQAAPGGAEGSPCSRLLRQAPDSAKNLSRGQMPEQRVAREPVHGAAEKAGAPRPAQPGPPPPALREQPPKYLHRHAQIQVLTHPRGTGDIRFLKISSGPWAQQRRRQIIQSPWVPGTPPVRSTSPPPARAELAPVAGRVLPEPLWGALKGSPPFSQPAFLSGYTSRRDPCWMLTPSPQPERGSRGADPLLGPRAQTSPPYLFL